ncbi:hypothetical protein [Paracidovorax wautersii]|uniref:Uncharacterized protein n=1 Tax=Paracidovorax wautersii TaxID=1177982 RepID=A0A1I2DLN2_9BURK|nr:hypothetical protein [Paracidovorax wautersii]SFE80830.1 hypothetical protein SAMN04489711_105253 [Paracidovorax wautersii]
MATPNYGYEKRQRELAKKKKKEEKLQAKSQRKTDDHPHGGSGDGADGGAVNNPAQDGTGTPVGG